MAKERLYLPRSHGGRGLENEEMAWEREAVASTHYLMRSEDPQVQGAIEMADGENGSGKEEGLQFHGASPVGAETVWPRARER